MVLTNGTFGGGEPLCPNIIPSPLTRVRFFSEEDPPPRTRRFSTDGRGTKGQEMGSEVTVSLDALWSAGC